MSMKRRSEETICEYIEDVFPNPSGLPADAIGRAQSRTISRIVDLYLSPASTALARHVNPERRDAAVVAEQAEVLTKVWGYFDSARCSDFSFYVEFFEFTRRLPDIHKTTKKGAKKHLG